MNILLISDNNIISKNIIKLIPKYNWVFISKSDFSINLLCESILVDRNIIKIVYFYSNTYNKKDTINETYLIHYCNKYNIDTLYLFYYDKNKPLILNIKNDIDLFLNFNLKFIMNNNDYIFGEDDIFISNKENNISSLIYKIFISKRDDEIINIDDQYLNNFRYIYILDLLEILNNIILDEKNIYKSKNKINILVDNNDIFDIKNVINIITKYIKNKKINIIENDNNINDNICFLV